MKAVSAQYFILIVILATVDAQVSCWSPPNVPLTRIEHSAANVLETGDGPGEFRIKVHFTERAKNFSKLQQLTDIIVTPAVEFWKKTLIAKNYTKGLFHIGRQCNGNKFERRTDDDGVSRMYCLEGCAPQTGCSEVAIPDEYLGECREIKDGEVVVHPAGAGLKEVDYVLFVDILLSAICQQGTMAYALPCAVEDTLDRPIAGYVNFCPNHMKLEFPGKVDYLSTGIHEIGHALGFISAMFAFFREENGFPRTPRDNVTRLPILGQDANGAFIPCKNTLDEIELDWNTVTGSYKKKMKILTTENLVKEARAHYDCPTMTGVQMEDNGGPSTVGSHFKQRMAYNEIMAGVSAERTVISRLTLAFFKDSGWYEVNMSMAEDWTWGKGLGCTFVERSCYDYMNEQKSKNMSIAPFCDEVGRHKSQCLGYDNGYGWCNLLKHDKPVAPENQYFKALPNVSEGDLPNYAGEFLAMDYCPIRVGVVGNGSRPTTFCSQEGNNKLLDPQRNYSLQSYGSESLCINHGGKSDWYYVPCDLSVGVDVRVSSSCMKFRCSDSDGLLLSVGNNEFHCPLDGGNIDVYGSNKAGFVKGTAVCPKCSTICQNCPHEQSQQEEGKLHPLPTEQYCAGEYPYGLGS